MLLTVCASKEITYSTYSAFCASRFFSLFVLPEDAANFSLPYPIDTVLFMRPDLAPSLADTAAALRGRYPGVKIITVAPKTWDKTPLSPDREFVFSQKFQTRSVIAELLAMMPPDPHASRTVGSTIVHGLYLDSVARQAFLYGTPISLSSQDFQLLLFLCARAPMRVTKEEIARCCSVPGKDVLPSSIYVRICRINAKAKHITGRPLVTARFNEGYSIAE